MSHPLRPPPRPPVRVAIPGLRREVGLGQLIHRMASSLGARPCEGCLARARWLNERLVFVTRSRK